MKRRKRRKGEVQIGGRDGHDEEEKGDEREKRKRLKGRRKDDKGDKPYILFAFSSFR